VRSVQRIRTVWLESSPTVHLDRPRLSDRRASLRARAFLDRTVCWDRAWFALLVRSVSEAPSCPAWQNPSVQLAVSVHRACRLRRHVILRQVIFDLI